MKARIVLLGLLSFAMSTSLRAQEANSGFDLAATVTAEGLYSHELSGAPRDANSADGVFRAVLYPTWKISNNWSVSAAVEAYSYPYYFQDLTSTKNGTAVDVLQAQLSYSRFWGNRSVVVKVGQLSSAFGSFILRYDDAVNPLVDVPMSYGYYKGVTLGSLAGAEVDATQGKVDVRGQFTNSSPINPQSILSKDQYANWTVGAGYTILQGFRIGASAFRGPYLNATYPYYFPGEAAPHGLPATALGVDMQWGRGPWNVNAEWQHFQMDYHAIPMFTEQTGYGEARLVLHPRWYVATRLGYTKPTTMDGWQTYEFSAGYRPIRRELVKAEYEIQRGLIVRGGQQSIVALQFVTTLGPVSFGTR